MFFILFFQLVVISNIFAIDKSDQIRGGNEDGWRGRSDNAGRVAARRTLKGFICFNIITDTLSPNNIITPNQVEDIVKEELTRRGIEVGRCERINPYSKVDNTYYMYSDTYFATIVVDLEIISLKESDEYIYVISFTVNAHSTMTRFPRVVLNGDIWELQPNPFFVDIGTVEEIKEKIKEITGDFAYDYNAKVEWPKDNLWDMK